MGRITGTIFSGFTSKLQSKNVAINFLDVASLRSLKLLVLPSFFTAVFLVLKFRPSCGGAAGQNWRSALCRLEAIGREISVE